jgi:hypothetical protein
MENLKTRLVTSTALVTAVLTFYNLPVQANPELLEGAYTGVQGIHRVAIKETLSLKDAPIQDLPLDIQKSKIEVTLPETIVAVEQAPKAAQQMVDPTPAKEMTATTLKPLVEVVNGKKRLNLETEEFNLVKEMNDISYNLVKGYGSYNKLANEGLMRLQEKGWKFTPVGGLEGNTSNFSTIAAVIFYHPETDRAVFCDIGTASNAEGWETNLKGNKVSLTVHEMQHQYVKDLYIEAKEMLDIALHPEEQATNPQTSASQEVLNIIETKLAMGINLLDPKSIRKAAAKINKAAIHDQDMTDAALLEKAQKLVRKYMAKSGLKDSQFTTVAKVLQREALIHRDMVKVSQNEEYRAALKQLKTEFSHYQNMNRTSLKDKFEKAVRSLSTGGKKSKHQNELTDDLVKFGKEDHSFQKAIMGYGALKLLIQDGKLSSNPLLEDHLERLFEVKFKVMSTVARLEDRATKNGKDHIALGEVHLGYLQKTITMMEEGAEKLKALGVNSKSKLIFTGHSQGGGLAGQNATLLTDHYGQELFGQGHEIFDNKKTNNVSVCVFSAARAGDETFADWAHDTLGRDNFYRHNVTEDIVPIAAADNALGAWIKAQNSMFYSALRDNLGYGDIGHLGVQSGHETWQIAKQMYADEGFDVSKFDRLDRFIRFLASFKFGSDGVPTALAGESENISFVYEPGKWVWDRIWGSYAVTYTGVQGVRALMGNEEIMAEMADLFMKRYAHIHLGYDDGISEDGTHLGARYNAALIIDPNQALANGVEHEKARTKRK